MQAITIEDPIDIVIGDDVVMETFVAKETMETGVAVQVLNGVKDRSVDEGNKGDSLSTNAVSCAEEMIESQNHETTCQQSYDDIIERRVKDCIKKRKQRENLDFRKKESAAAKERMANKRSDPKYRDKERQRDRERKAEARKNGNFREKEKIRDRLYRQRLKKGHTTLVDGECGKRFCDNSVAVVVELQEAV